MCCVDQPFTKSWYIVAIVQGILRLILCSWVDMKTDMLFNTQSIQWLAFERCQTLYKKKMFSIIANQVDVVQVLNKSLNKRLHKKKTEF